MIRKRIVFPILIGLLTVVALIGYYGYHLVASFFSDEKGKDGDKDTTTSVAVENRYEEGAMEDNNEPATNPTPPINPNPTPTNPFPDVSGVEIPFSTLSSYNPKPDELNRASRIYYYNLQAHYPEMASEVDFNQETVLQLLVNKSMYQGYDLEVKKMERLPNGYIRFTVSLKPGSGSTPPATYVKVKNGSVPANPQEAKFQVVDETGKRVLP